MGGVRILVAAYREWALRVTGALLAIPGVTWVVISRPEDLEEETGRLDAAFFVGWSWKVPPNWYGEVLCYAIHPSILPKWRGGSPVQNQILAGERFSGVTLFRLTGELDAGPVVAQLGCELTGSLDDVFGRVAMNASLLLGSAVRELLAGHPLAEHPQEGTPTYGKRRRVGESEIHVNDFKSQSALQLATRVRALAGQGYPPAYVTCRDGKRLVILRAEVGQ